MMLPGFVTEELEHFLAGGKPGSITLNYDGQAIRHVEVKTIRREEPHDTVKT